MLRFLTTCLLLLKLALLSPLAKAAPNDYPFQAVSFERVKIKGGFWGPRFQVNRDVTVRYDFRKCEQTGRIDNFLKAGKQLAGSFVGIPFNDSDVFKIVEGASYSLATHPDPQLSRYLDLLVAKIALAQEEDGYLYSARTIDPSAEQHALSGPRRWSRLALSHELYNVGHLYEAAVAHHQATGKRTLLDVALRNADLVVKLFGPKEGQLREPPGHQEIEIGLVKLHRVTGKQAYLDLARFFLDQRGRSASHALRGREQQDHLPVLEQREAVGHAVRAAYMYCGMADVAALSGDPAYTEAIDHLWDDVVSKKMYVTGGIGARRGGESFGDAYELPNAEAYSETCAAIANALWNQRMFQLHGDAKYVDVLERILYNGFLSGIALQGDKFFYPNPLACDGKEPFNQGVLGRSPWFDCSCCPVNVVRFMPSIAGYVYGQQADTLHVNLFVQGEATVVLPNNTINIGQQTNYPWDGTVKIAVEPDQETEWTLAVRIPGWAVGKPVPSDLYHDLQQTKQPTIQAWTLQVNGKPANFVMQKGFARITRTWQSEDVVELTLPLEIRRVVAHEKVEANRGRVALERGPLVYCVEGTDHETKLDDLVLTDKGALKPVLRSELLGGMVTLTGEALVRGNATKLTAIPYYAWANRDVGEMAVWLRRQ